MHLKRVIKATCYILPVLTMTHQIKIFVVHFLITTSNTPHSFSCTIRAHGLPLQGYLGGHRHHQTVPINHTHTMPIPEQYNTSLCVRKPTIWSSDQVRHKPGCTLTEDGYREADLHLCFRICKLLVFSCTGSITISSKVGKKHKIRFCRQ